MAKKTFKIGESCMGGIISVETKGSTVTLIGREWDYSKGPTKGTSQANAKEFCRISVDLNTGDESDLTNFLHDLTTSYYVDMVMKWVNNEVVIRRNSFW